MTLVILTPSPWLGNVEFESRPRDCQRGAGYNKQKGYDMTTTETSDARRVCDSHVEELERFEEWVSEFVYGSTCEDLADIASDEDEDEERRSLAGGALAWLDDNGADELSWLSFMSDALDVEVTGTLVQGRWELSGVALLVGFGGPTVRLVAVDDSTIRVEVSWWSDSAERTIDVGLAGALWAYAEAVAG